MRSARIRHLSAAAAAAISAGALACSWGVGPATGAPRAHAGAGAAITRHAAGSPRLRQPVRAVGIAADPATGGYWILKSTGGVDAFHAPWHGSLAGHVPAGTAVTAIAAGRSGGYLILTSDGGVHAFGTPEYGSDAGRLRHGVRAVGLAADPGTGGYWILTSAGGVSNFHAPWHGSLAGHVPAASVAAGLAAGRGGGYLVLTTAGGRLPRALAGRVWDVLPTRGKVVALTFDIGPVSGVPSILATLRRDHARATFFVTGRRAAGDQRAVRAIEAAGELVGNHSNNHPDFTTISDARVRQQILTAQARIESVTGLVTWPWFRFPYGAHSARTVAAVNSAGYAPVGWTVDTLGWEGYSSGVTVREIVARVLGAVRPGEIVLMHGGSDSGDGSHPDADALPIMIRRLRALGYSFVTMNFLHSMGEIIGASDGLVHAYGTPAHGSDARRLRAGVTAVGIAADPATGGYWIVKSTGGVDAFGVPWRGSLAGKIPAGAIITGIAAGLPGGYLVLTSDGGVHAFGTPYYGSDAGH